ncbi:MAG: hypothetical protein AB9M53_01075 [Leptothrix sp. (in: b-proteobacteria)]
MSGNFEALLAELTDEVATMSKAMPMDGDDDKKIMAAAEEGEANGEDGDEDDEMDADGKPVAKKPMDKPFGKSMTVTTEEGEEVEAIDGTELVKGLMDQVQGFGAKLEAAQSSEATLAKALEQTLTVVKGQGELIKSLQAQVGKLSDAGRGRKSSVTVHEPPTIAKSMDAGAATITPNELMAKCFAAQQAGRLTGLDVARAENYLNSGASVPADILSRI